MNQHEIYKLDKRCVARHNDLAKHINRISKEQARMQTNENVEIAKEIFSHAYGKASSYSNVIIAAGYVGFFTLWGSLKKDLPDWAVLLSGFLILLSVMIFIGFELFKMISSSIQMHRVSKRLQNPSIGTLLEIQKIEQNNALKSAKIWVFTIIPTILFGFSAGMILLACFLIEFIEPYLKQT
ncbi:hypothetical protein [Aliivibrio fischeri]|uniref:hypothetical protein n=1 Tax=Aliivibrio fischeri TaxID=668 RepID=UPI0007C47427|nr:hypothetical protein [Aliivibrio fischeri]